MKKRALRIGLLLLVLIVLMSGCASYQFIGSTYLEPKPAPPIEGIGQDGSPFALSEQAGKIVLVFFGYTYCPDVCPTTLAEFKQIKNALGKYAEEVEFVFVSVDPERDTPERLAEYVGAFDQDFRGIFIAPDQLPAVLKQYGAVAEKQPAASGDPGAYTIDHTARTYLIDPQGRLYLSYAFGTPTEDILSDIGELLRTSGLRS